MFYPEQIIIEEPALQLPYTKKLVNKFKDVPTKVICEIKDTKKILFENFTGKKIFLITDYKGNLIKKCPGSRGVICCNYYVANIINGCPFACTYCILQDYINCGSVMICANIDRFFDELKKLQRDNFTLRVGTGELADSLAFDTYLDLSSELIPRLKDYPNVVLELKTKSACIENVLKYDAKEQVVLGWSLNPQELIDSDEKYSASLEERLKSAKKAVDAGFKTSFHFDPVILIHCWEQKYKDVVDKIFDFVPADMIAWISIGGLRFTPALKKIYRRDFPESRILSYGEFTMSEDGKYRYFRPIRFDMYKKMVGFIKNHGTDIPVYFCMESSRMWKDVMGSLPSGKKELGLTFNPYPAFKLEIENDA